MILFHSALVRGRDKCFDIMVMHMARQVSLTVSPTKLELTLRCQDLPKSDLFSKSDPMCVVYLKDSSQAEWTEVGRTEVINDDHDPKWAKKVEVNYSFETK